MVALISLVGGEVIMKRICGNCLYWIPTKPEPKICKQCGGREDNRVIEDAIARRNFIPREMKCGVCEEVMIYNKRLMVFSCQCCGTDTFPHFNKVDDSKVIREEFEKELPCERNTKLSKGMIHVKSKASGSKSGKGRSKKQLMQKPSTTALYKALASKPNKIKLKKDNIS